MIEIIQHFKIQLYYIYKQVFLGHWVGTVFIQETFFVHTRTHSTPIHLHARTPYSDAHTTCEVSSKIIPINYCAVYSSFTMFLFVLFIILCNSKLRAPYLSIQILPSRSPGNQLSFVDRAQEITVINHILPKSSCCLLLVAIWII